MERKTNDPLRLRDLVDALPVVRGGAVTEEPRPDCWLCRHSIGADRETARRLAIGKGYGDDHSNPRGGVVIVCLERQRINAEPRSTPGRRCTFEREPGAEG